MSSVDWMALAELVALTVLAVGEDQAVDQVKGLVGRACQEPLGKADGVAVLVGAGVDE